MRIRLPHMSIRYKYTNAKYAVHTLYVHIHYIWLIRFGCECAETALKCLGLLKVVLSGCCVTTAVNYTKEKYCAPTLFHFVLASTSHHVFSSCAFWGRKRIVIFKLQISHLQWYDTKYQNAESLALCSITNSLEWGFFIYNT